MNYRFQIVLIIYVKSNRNEKHKTILQGPGAGVLRSRDLPEAGAGAGAEALIFLMLQSSFCFLIFF